MALTVTSGANANTATGAATSTGATNTKLPPANGTKGGAGFSTTANAAKTAAAQPPATRPAAPATKPAAPKAPSKTAAARTGPTQLAPSQIETKLKEAAAKAPFEGRPNVSSDGVRFGAPQTVVDGLKASAKEALEGAGSVTRTALKAASKRSASQYMQAAKDPAKRELLVKALTGKASAELDPQQRAKVNAFLDGVAAGTAPQVNAKTAGMLDDPAKITAARWSGATMLVKGVKGAFVDKGAGKPGTILVSNRLNTQQLNEAMNEEFGEALAAAAERAGIKTAGGDDGNRLRLALEGKDTSTKAAPQLSAGRKDDTTTVMVDGRVVDAKALIFPGTGLTSAIKLSGLSTDEFVRKAAGVFAARVKNYINSWKKNPANAAKNLALFIIQNTNLVGAIILGSIDLSKEWDKMNGSQRALAIGLIAGEAVASAIPGGALAAAGSRALRVLGDASKTIAGRNAGKVPALTGKMPANNTLVTNAKINELKSESGRTGVSLTQDWRELKAQEKLLLSARKELVTAKRGKDYAERLADVDAALGATRAAIASVDKQTNSLAALQIKINGLRSGRYHKVAAATAVSARQKANDALEFAKKVRTLQTGRVNLINGATAGIATLKPNAASLKTIDTKIAAVNQSFKVQSDRINAALGKLTAKGQDSGQIVQMGNFKKAMADLKKQLDDAKDDALAKLNKRKAQLTAAMPDPVWSAVTGLAANIYTPGTGQFRNPAIANLATKLDAQMAAYVRGARARVQNNGGAWRNTNDPEITPATPTASQTGSSATRPGTPENHIADGAAALAKNTGLTNALNATFKGLITSGATGAAATALGSALSKLGMPLLNGGKPYALCMFAYGPGWDKQTKAGKLNGGANGPFVIYSPPKTQTSPATIWISIYPPGQPNIGGSKVGHALSFGFAVDPRVLGMGNPGNTGAGHNISIGDFTWLSRTPQLPKGVATLTQRLRNAILPTRSANALVMKQVTVGGSVSPGAGINTASGAGWVGLAAGTNIVFGPAGPDQQKTAANKLIARNAPTISAAFWVAPPQNYYNFNWRTWK